jgi:WD40 repeat protein
LVSYILELLDGRIAVSCCGGAISLNQMNYETKEWTVLTQKNNAHDGIIESLCEINNKRIISSSVDKTIKVWDVSSNEDIKLIKELTQHKDKVNKVITLTCIRFASCSSDDCTVKLWNSDTYELIPIPFEKQIYPDSLLQLKRQREVLVVSCCSKKNPSLHFYQLCHPYELLGKINNVCTTYMSGLIELSNGHVAASHYNPNCIYIVDTQKYELVTTIVDKEYIPDCGPLYVFGNDSFIYVSLDGGCFCEVSMMNGEYKISFKTKESDNNLLSCISLVNDGKYFISGNRYGGCSIYSYSY